jgi:phosphosulfolactate phosphohydrolase-like enzyme
MLRPARARDASRRSALMRLQRCRPVELSSQRVHTLVVIDVLRMTSTASVLMRRASATGLAVAATFHDLAGLPQPAPSYLLVSELADASWPGAWIDNSPARAASHPLDGRTPLLVTTNGTRALLAAAACAERVLLASFLDLRAVARHLRAAAPPSVLILPAGNIERDEACIEDDLCADALQTFLAGDEPDLPACAAQIRADARIRRRIAREEGFAADLDLALESDPGAPVLAFHPRQGGVGHIGPLTCGDSNE